MDLAKAGISAAIGAALMGGFLTLLTVGATTLGTTFATSAAVFVIGAVAISITVGLGLDWLDKQKGVTSKIAEKTRDIFAYLENKNSADYTGYASGMEMAFAP